MNEPVLEFVDVVKTFGKGSSEVRALGGVDLAVAPGEFVAIMGPSGCGKSTMLHLAGGLKDSSSGRVRVHGRDIGDLDLTERATLRRTDVGYVFQRLNLLPHSPPSRTCRFRSNWKASAAARRAGGQLQRSPRSV